MTEAGPIPKPDVASLPAKDPDALRAALAELAPAVRRFIFALCGDWHRSEDLAQDAMLRAWKARAGFDGRANLRTWVFSIARNGLLSQVRQKARRPAEENMTALDQISARPTADPAARLARVELADAVRRAMDRLPPEQREVLALRESRKLTFAEVADVLGVPVATVKSRARYGLLKLAGELEPFRQELD